MIKLIGYIAGGATILMGLANIYITEASRAELFGPAPENSTELDQIGFFVSANIANLGLIFVGAAGIWLFSRL